MAGKRGNGENSIYQSGGRWHVQGYVNGRRRRVSRLRRADAVLAWAEMVKSAPTRSQRRPGVVDSRPARTVAEALERWYELSDARWRPSTRVGYRGTIDRHLRPHLGTVRVDRLRVEDIERWQHTLREAGLSTSTIRQARIVLGQAMAMLVRFGELGANPVPVAASVPRSAKEPTFLTEEEAAAVLASATDPRDKARWLLALTLGLRSGEALGLRWQDLDLDSEHPRLMVTGSLQYQSGVGLVRVATKTVASRRTVLLNPPHVDALRALRAQQAAQRLAAGGDFNPDGYVFVTPRGTPVDPNNDSKRWHKLLSRAGVRQVRRHDARHTAATLLLGSGAGLANVQKVLGHSTISTTVDVYGHLTAADSVTFTATIAARLSSPTPGGGAEHAAR